MTRAQRLLCVLAVVSVGIWGCSQGDSKSATAAASRQLEKIKALEEKCATLEQEGQALLTARDQMQKRMNELDKERVRLNREVESLKMVCQERDDLKNLVVTRTTERDTYQGQLVELQKGIRTLLSRVEASLAPMETEQKSVTISLPVLPQQ